MTNNSRPNEGIFGVANCKLNDTKNQPCDKYIITQRITNDKDDSPIKRQNSNLDVVDIGEKLEGKE